MLSVYTENGFLPVVNRKNFKIIYDYEGGQTLSFDIATNDEIYPSFFEENVLRYEDNEFKIKKKNQRKVKSSIEASLNMDEWKSSFYHQFHKTYKLFSEIINLIIPDGWTVEGAGTVTGRHTVDIEGGSAYDILMQCKSVYGIVYEYHILKKTIKVVKPDTFQSRGLYITDELNLRNLEFKGDSSDFVTRLYAFGKKTEEKDEEGNVTKVSYVTFADINGGKAYVDNNDYSERIIVSYWQDDRYTDPESLLNDAVDKLKSLSIPVRSYSCDLIDLSRINDKYKYLDFTLYDKVTLLDSVSKTYVQHQIVEYVDYPDNRNNNTVSLSSVFKKITGTIDGIKQSISNIDTELLRKESTINEIIRDVKSNTLRINDTYTKGEVDAIEESIIQQTSDSIDLAVQKIENKIQEIDTSLFTYELLNDGTNITEDSNVILSANVFNKGEDITDTLEDIAFKWIRQSKDTDGDQEWNDNHQALKSVTLTAEDVDVSAVFYCQITMDFGIQRTQSITITDQTDIAQLGNSFVDANTSLIQTLEDDVYFPDWTVNNAVITPAIINGVVNVDISECEITYKRVVNNTESDLISGETVQDGILTVSKNVLSKEEPAITYVCYVTYKNSSIKLYIGFYLYAIAQDGEKGEDGKDGTDGISVVNVVSYFAISNSDTVEPSSGWITSKPERSEGQWIWRKDVTRLSDGTEITTPAYVVTGDKGDTGEQGIQGPKGDDGIQYYTWLKYADTPTSGMSDNPDGKNYIGLAYNKTSPTESSNYSDYTWSLIKGEKGDQGIQGPSGENGKSLYTWLKYADTPTSGMSDNPDGKKYIGLAYNKTTPTESVNYSDYQWSLVKGDKGDTGATGPAGKGIKGTPVVTYQAGTSATTPPTAKWQSSVPAVSQGQYLWSKTVYTYTDNSTSTIYAVNRNPVDGADGNDGKGIKTAVTTYQASSSGTVVPTGTWSSSIPSTNAGQYLWTRTITTYTDNSTSTAYSVGRNGTNGADAAVMSDTAPDDKNKLWYDTANDLLKHWDGEAWVVVNDYADDMNNMKQQITTEYSSAINQLKESLTTLVEKLQTTTTENTTSINSLSSQIAQNATSITMATTSIQEITDKLTGLTTKEEISKWARYEDGILELGSSDSPFAVKLSQTELGFYQNGTRIAYLSNQQLNISQAVVMQQINIGTFQIIFDEDYGLMFM